jgi:copper oxidase (laccase) domain-containing protein
VDATLRQAMSDRFGPQVVNGDAVDLGLACIAALRGAGVEADAISVVGACTSCDSERFFSYRRDGAATGRQAGIVWIGESA